MYYHTKKEINVEVETKLSILYYESLFNLGYIIRIRFLEDILYVGCHA
jgi:hypothetical protein